MSGSCPVSAHVCQETAWERDELRAKVERLRAGINALATAGARGIDLTPTTCGTVTPQWAYDYLATLDGAWRDHVRALLNPTEGENR